MYVSLYLIILHDENTDVRFVTTLRKFFNLTEKDVVIRTRLKVGLSIVQFCQKEIHALYPSFRNYEPGPAAWNILYAHTANSPMKSTRIPKVDV